MEGGRELRHSPEDRQARICRGWWWTLAATAILYLAAPAAASAAVRYAEPGGDGAEPCAQTDPCDIQRAVEGDPGSPDEVHDGDEVILLPGDYNIGTDPVVVVDGVDVHGPTFGPPARIVWSGFGVAMEVSASAATLRDLEITRALAGEAGTGPALGISAGTVERVIADTGSTLGRPACVLVQEGATPPLLRDSICWSDDVGVFAAPPSSGTSNIILRNVTAVGTQGGLKAEAQSTNSTIVDAKNVIALGGGGAGNDVIANAVGSGSTATVTLAGSNYRTETEAGAGTATVTDPGPPGNQTAFPSLDGAFHQLADSETIDAGVPDAQNGSADVDGEPRVNGAAIDIGGDEYTETDGDGVPDYTDNCPGSANAGQENNDMDDEGDACDPDDDNDGVPDASDSCPVGAGSGVDTDADGCKDSEDADDDNDGVGDPVDVCQSVAGPAANMGCPLFFEPPPPTERTITLEASKSKVKKGKKVTLSGRIASQEPACEPGQSVELQAGKGANFKLFTETTTDATGNYALKVRVTKTSLYRAHLDATRACGEEVSNSQKVKALSKKR